MRTDENNNPTAFTTDVARKAGLILGTDYDLGTIFPDSNLHTARLLGDPIVLTIRVIDKIGFFTRVGAPRWEYIAIPKFLWDTQDSSVKLDIIGEMYRHEGGTTMRSLFPNYGKLTY